MNSLQRIPWVRIPTHWRVLKVKHLAAVLSSNVDKKTVEGEKSVRLCNYTDVYYNAQITGSMELMVATATAAEMKKFLLRAGDVIVTKDSESWDDIAVPTYVPESLEDVVCGYHLALIRPNPDVVLGRYLYYCFAAEPLNRQFQVEANGITRFGLSLGSLGGARFPVPPLDEQREIVEFLDLRTAALDSLISGKNDDISRVQGHIGREVRALREYRQALISAAVLGRIPVVAEVVA